MLKAIGKKPKKWLEKWVMMSSNIFKQRAQFYRDESPKSIFEERFQFYSPSEEIEEEEERIPLSAYKGGLLSGLSGKAEKRPIQSAIQKKGLGFIPRQLGAGITDIGATLEQIADPRQLLNLLEENPEVLPPGIFETISEKLKGSKEGLSEEEIAAGEELGTLGSFALDPLISKALGPAKVLSKGKKAPELFASKSQKPLVEKLMKRGFRPEEITPLIQNPKKLNFLSKLAQRSEKVKDRLYLTKERIGLQANKLRELGKTLPGLQGTRLNAFKNSFNKVLEDIPKDYQRLLKEDLQDLSNSTHTGKDLIDFYRAIYRKVKGEEGGKAVLNRLKEPIQKGLKLINPSLAEEFKFNNKLFKDFYSFAKKMKPRDIDELIGIGEALAIGKGIASGDINLLSKVASGIGGRVLATELLLNPKFQNIGKRIKFYADKGNTKMVKRLTTNAIAQVLKENPSLIEEFEFED